MKPKKGMTASKIVQLIEGERDEAQRLLLMHVKNGNSVGEANCMHKQHELNMLLYLIAE